ncbi:MAG TPA: HNH endonuclease [Solirubrobacterales bacterium]|nr:HNH endonuclease [Solirubrobacterales bacterium]
MHTKDDPHVGLWGAGAAELVRVTQAAGHSRTNGWAHSNGNGRNGHVADGAAIGGRVLVLNASYEPINVCNLRRATVLVLKERAEIIERGQGALHSERLTFVRPCVIRLIRYVRIPRDVHRRKITRKAVLARDAWTCQYCGSQATGLTVDHVIPRSRGGESVWENIVASCAPCNRKKGSMTPREAKMHPRSHPRPPGPTVFIRLASPRIPVAWEPYLLAA